MTRHVLVGGQLAAEHWARTNSVDRRLLDKAAGPICVHDGFDVMRKLAGIRGPLTVVKLHDWQSRVGFVHMARLRDVVHAINARDGMPDVPVSAPIRETVPAFVAPILPYDDDGPYIPGVGPVREALYDGRCPNCGDRIDVGDEIRMQDGRAVHDGCEGE